MSQTLLIHDNLQLSEILSLNLPVYVGTDVILKKNFKESKILMEHHPGINLIVCADMVDGEPTAELAFDFYQNIKKNVPFIITGNKTKVPKSELITVLPNNDLQTILQNAAKFLNITPKDMVDKIVPDFYQLNTYYCLNISEAPCNIYIQDKNRHILKYQTNEIMNPREVHELMNNGHSNIYVEAHERLKLVNHVTTSLSAILLDAKTDPKLKIGIAEKSLQVLQDEALKDEGHIEMSVKILAISAIKTCMEIAKKNPKVATLLRDLLSNRTSYRFKHMQLCMYICNHIISRLDWGSSEVKEKLAFVVFFHDICLTDDKLAKITADNFEEMKPTLTKEEIDLVMKHAKLAADIVQKFPIAPIGSDALILQHHGMLRGLGFSSDFAGGELTPLAMVFIVAEEMTHMILDQDNVANMSEKKEEMIKRLYEKFPRAKFTKIIEILESISF